MAVIVKDIMSKPVHVIDYKKNAQQAAKILSKFKKGFLVVTRGKKAIGVLTASDLVSSVVAENKLAKRIKIEDIMSKPIVTVSPNDTILTAARKLKRNGIHRLPVVDKGKVVGVISMTDIVIALPEMLDLLETRLKMEEEPFAIKEERTTGICDSCDNYYDDLRKVNDQWLCETCKDREEAEKGI